MNSEQWLVDLPAPIFPPLPMPFPALKLAIAAAARGMWSEVIAALQNMPLDEDLEIRSQVLDLALQVLLSGDFEQQWEVAKIVPKLGDIAIAPLLELLNNSDIEIEERWFVARILGEFDRADVIAALLTAIRQGEDPELSEIATGALAKIGTSAIIALAELLTTADGAIAVRALAQIRHSHTIEPLMSAIAHAAPQVRSLTVEALGSFHDPRIPPLLLTKLTDPAARVRQAAVVALSRRGDLSAELDLVRQLQPLLFDLNLGVCEATALGLARLPDPAAVEVLAEVLMADRTPPSLRSQVILALGWIGTRAALDRSFAALTTAAPATIGEIVTSIGNTELERTYASQLLVAYLRANVADLSAHLKQEIATALGNLGDIQSVPELIQLLEDPTERVKLYTVAAIAKLSPVIPTEILQLADRSDLSPELQLGVRMCLSHWQMYSAS
jgi:HEAT repeat protein